MSTRRRGLGGWLARLKTWHQVLVFLGASGALGFAVLSGLSGFERRTGILAEQFGFARAIDLRDVGDDVKSWQLFSDIRRLRRTIDDAGPPQTPTERERFRDLTDQLATMQSEQDRISTRRAKR